MHIVNQRLGSLADRITVLVVGCGGTGSNILNNLAKLDYVLRKLGYPGIFVVAVDGDCVSETNVGRQDFIPSDIGMPKAAVLITRINRRFGLDWMAKCDSIENMNIKSANIVFTATDNIKSRRFVKDYIITNKTSSTPAVFYYWIDCGNGNDFGQIVLSNNTKELPTIFDLYDVKEDTETPSCSMAESLRKQSLFINQTVAMYAVNMLYEMITKLQIDYTTIFINNNTLQLNTIKHGKS